jgi:ribonuclease R
MGKAKGAPAGKLPSRAEVLRYIENRSQPVGRREIATHFRLKGEQRIRLKEMLEELEEAGEIERGEKRRVRPAGALPEVSVVQITETDADGELLGEPIPWKRRSAPPRIYVAPDRPGAPTVTTGTRVLAQLNRIEPGVYEARPIRVLGGAPKRVLGVYQRGGKEGRLQPTDKRVKQEYVLRPEDAGDAQPGDFVLCEVKPHHPRMRMREVRVVERLGDTDSPKAISLIAIHENDIPFDFGQRALDEAEQAGAVSQAGREDLREVPLVTIDGADAKDFDDAVWAAPDDGPANPGGFKLIVAIADVAHYVRPGSALDKTAYHRGNSVYFPDRVVPMLPEALSNGWCSLRPGEDRGCLAAEMRIDAHGRLLSKRFTRALMRSHARLTYEQVQAAREGNPDDTTAPLRESVIDPLFDAFAALLHHREQRGTLDLDIPEKQVLVDAHGEVTGIFARERLDAHRLIEEFMICANVAAAQQLEAKNQPCMYRVHESPDPDKIDSLKQTLDTFGINIAMDQIGHPSAFQQILARVRGQPEAPMVNELILRSQSQAYYSPDNLGHFGLALARYAHFTSPIRRYADLLVHRALIDGLKLGEDGLGPGERERFHEIGEHISQTERRAQGAEYDALDRFTAAYLRERTGAHFDGRVNGVTRFGLFVTLLDSGADGLVPIGTLPDDYYRHDEANHCLIGDRWQRVYSLGDRVTVALAEADPMTGGITLHMVAVQESASPEVELADGEPIARGGPGKGRRRHAAQRSKSARAAATKAKQTKAKAKAKTKAKTKANPPKAKPAAKGKSKAGTKSGKRR